jgi:hypothetical protein
MRSRQQRPPLQISSSHGLLRHCFRRGGAPGRCASPGSLASYTHHGPREHHLLHRFDCLGVPLVHGGTCVGHLDSAIRGAQWLQGRALRTHALHGLGCSCGLSPGTTYCGAAGSHPLVFEMLRLVGRTRYGRVHRSDDVSLFHCILMTTTLANHAVEATAPRAGRLVRPMFHYIIVPGGAAFPGAVPHLGRSATERSCRESYSFFFRREFGRAVSIMSVFDVHRFTLAQVPSVPAKSTVVLPGSNFRESSLVLGLAPARTRQPLSAPWVALRRPFLDIVE